MTNEDRRNEHRKLFGTWMNTIATAVITVGTFIPIGQTVFNFLPMTVEIGLVYGTAIVCIAAGVGIHLIGHVVIGTLE